MFTFEDTPVKDAKIVTPQVFADDRGFFLESYNQREFQEAGISETFVQDNHSRSQKNVLRGIHFQYAPHQQAKLVRVTQGEVFDVIVDLRPDSETFKKWFGVTLSAENKKMLYVPAGFGHGFCVTADDTDFIYKCDQFYVPEADGGMKWDDPELAIDWPISADQAIVSQKDQNLPPFSEVKDRL